MDVERLHYMANQILRNFAVSGEEVAVTETAKHITQFWDPRMIRAFVEASFEAGNQLIGVVNLLRGGDLISDSTDDAG